MSVRCPLLERAGADRDFRTVTSRHPDTSRSAPPSLRSLANARISWVEGQGTGARIDKDDGEEVEMFDAMGNSTSLSLSTPLCSADPRCRDCGRQEAEEGDLVRPPQAQEGANGTQEGWVRFPLSSRSAADVRSPSVLLPTRRRSCKRPSLMYPVPVT